MPSKVAPQELADLNLFQGLSEDAVQKILGECNDVTFAEGDAIFHAGENSSSLYILMKGDVEVRLHAPHHLETAIAKLSAKSVFGESSFFGGGPHHATIQCVTPVEAIQLDRAAFDNLIAQNCTATLRLGTNVAIILAVRLQAADQRIAKELQEEQDVRIKVALRRFHESLVHSFSGPPGFVHTGW